MVKVWRIRAGSYRYFPSLRGHPSLHSPVDHARENMRAAPVIRTLGVVPCEGLQKGGQDVSTRRGDRQATYRDLRDRTKRQERGREENLKRIVELRRERHLHEFQSRDGALGTDALE
jgi:hypothetical protein